MPQAGDTQDEGKGPLAGQGLLALGWCIPEEKAYAPVLLGYLSSHELSQARGEGQRGDEQGHESREEQASRGVGFTASNMGGARTTGERLGALTPRAEVAAELGSYMKAHGSERRSPLLFMR